jgi:hypothetical protein
VASTCHSVIGRHVLGGARTEYQRLQPSAPPEINIVVPKIYLINVGANTAHSSEARAPLFPDGRFHFVSFPDADHTGTYDRKIWPFLNNPQTLTTHADPDLANLTYGDNCYNRRAKSLLSVVAGDILLFWALFWKVGKGEDIFAVDSSRRRWCVFGALTVSDAIFAKPKADIELRDYISDPATLRRALKNAHVVQGKLLRVRGKRHEALFIGDLHRSARFDKAVDLEIYDHRGLLRRCVLSTNKHRLEWTRSPRWNSSLRSCRPVLDLSDTSDLARARQLRAAMRAANPKKLNLFPYA